MKFNLKREEIKIDSSVAIKNNVILDIPDNKEISPSINKNHTTTINIDNIYDFIRVVNVKGEPEYQANDDERVIVAHRGNPLLGNKHPMKMHTLNERRRVILENRKDLNKDLNSQGAIYQFLQIIAEEMIINNQKIAFSCFCLPCDCHAQDLVLALGDMVKEKLTNNIVPKLAFKK